MAQRKVSGSWGTADLNMNTSTYGINATLKAVTLFDFLAEPIGGLAKWTAGQSVADPVQPAELTSSSQLWEIVGWSVRFRGALVRTGAGAGGQLPSPNVKPQFGLLGALWAGLYRGSPSGSPQLPPDLSLVSKIWDGQTDAPFPSLLAAAATFPTLPAGFQLGFSTVLPEPLVLNPVDQVSMGLWLTSSLISGGAVAITDASWTVTYDLVSTAPTF